ncbi:MAG: hypothetical protein ACKVOE_00045 [Rickettsiales bacterium]
MYLLQSIGIVSHGVLFQQQRIAPAQKTEQFGALREQGYIVFGKHLARDVFLLKGQSDYILAAITDSHSVPEALGAIVDDAQEAIEALGKKRLDIFDGGAVGEMALHLPAFRDAQGRFIYLIEKNRTEDFYATDFEKIEE